MAHEPEPKNFEPKEPVQLDPPKDDPISLSELQKFNGERPCFTRPILRLCHLS